MSGPVNKHVINPWLASAISFALITFFFAGATLIHPHPLPTQKDLAELPWWAVVGGLVGAVQVLRGPNTGQQSRSRALRSLHGHSGTHLTVDRPFRLL